MPFDSLTLAILRKAELGFFGVVVVTLRQTPRLKDEPTIVTDFLRCKLSSVTLRAGDFGFLAIFFLPCLTNWLIVGIFTVICPTVAEVMS